MREDERAFYKFVEEEMGGVNEDASTDRIFRAGWKARGVLDARKALEWAKARTPQRGGIAFTHFALHIQNEDFPDSEPRSTP